MTVPSTQHGRPLAPWLTSPPSGVSGLPSTKNGPNTVASVAPAPPPSASVDATAPSTTGLLTPMVSMDSPSTSDSRMNSWRVSVVMSPQPLRNAMPCAHSASVSRTSRTKPCRCSTRLVSTSRSRGSAVRGQAGDDGVGDGALAAGLLLGALAGTSAAGGLGVIGLLRGGGPAGPGGADQRVDVGAADRAGVGDAAVGDDRGDQVDGPVEVGLGQADVAQPGRDAERVVEGGQGVGRAGGVLGAEGAAEPRRALAEGRGLEGEDVRQDDGVHRGVGQVERAAEHVARLVVQPRPGRGERRPGQPRAVEHPGARVEVAAVGDHAGQARGQRGDALEGHEVGDRVGAAGPTPPRRSGPWRSSRSRR